MATVQAKKIVRKSSKGAAMQSLTAPFTYYWKNLNFILFGVGIVLSLLGFFLSSVPPWNSGASLVVAPILLVVTYVVIFPMAILYSKKKSPAESTEQKEQ